MQLKGEIYIPPDFNLAHNYMVQSIIAGSQRSRDIKYQVTPHPCEEQRVREHESLLFV